MPPALEPGVIRSRTGLCLNSSILRGMAACQYKTEFMQPIES